ncbi:MAG: hypothetical protein PUF12_07965 [Thermoflexaceae bacterium]|nr:hypothetical protein [Thermoflexaceae bacterium]
MEIDAKKMKLINEFMELSKGRSTDEILPLLLAVSQKSRQMGLSFTKEEILSLVNQLKSDLPESEKAKVDLLINMML